MPSKIYVVGVGMTKFEKPGSRDYPEMAKEAGTKALQDAGVSYNQIEQAFVGYVYGDSTSGQRAVYELGLTGIPIVNVNNNCSTGSTALYLGKNAIESGKSHCVLALGFEKMQRGSLTSAYSDRSNPMEKHVEVMSNCYDISGAPMMPQMFGNAGRDYAKKYNLSPNDDVFARIAHKNHKHSVNNPYAQFNKEYSLEEIKSSPMIHEPLTKLQCSPTSDGAAAAVLASEEFVRKHGLESKAVEIVALEMATDLPSSFSQDADCMRVVGFDMSKLAAQKAFAKAGIKPQDVQVVELHDCFSANELITYDALGLCEPGKAAEMVRKGDNTYGGKYVVNPSGGLISKGHPLGATGIAQCSELSWQLRGQAGKRQVPNVKYALQHNIGLGGAAVVGIYRLGFPSAQQGAAASSTPAPSASTNPSSGSSSFKATTSQHKSGVFFDEVESRIKEEGAAFVDKVKATIGFNINCAGNKTFSYVLDLKTKPGSVFVNDGSFKPDCTITIGDDDLVSIADGKLNMMSAFTQKKVKLSGNMSVAMKLNQIFSSVISKKKSSATAASTTTTTSSAPVQSTQSQSTGSSALTQTTTKHKSGKFFEDVEAKLKTEGAAFVAKVNAVIGFQITSGSDSYSYIIDLKKSPGSVFVNNNNTKADVTVIISDDDLLSVMAGKLNMMSAFTQKKLKLSGNMSVAMKLNQIFASVIKSQAKL